MELLAALAGVLTGSGRDHALALIQAACGGAGQQLGEQQQQTGGRDVALLQRVEALARESSALREEQSDLREEFIAMAKLLNDIVELHDALRSSAATWRTCPGNWTGSSSIFIT